MACEVRQKSLYTFSYNCFHVENSIACCAQVGSCWTRCPLKWASRKASTKATVSSDFVDHLLLHSFCWSRTEANILLNTCLDSPVAALKKSLQTAVAPILKLIERCPLSSSELHCISSFVRTFRECRPQNFFRKSSNSGIPPILRNCSLHFNLWGHSESMAGSEDLHLVQSVPISAPMACEVSS